MLWLYHDLWFIPYAFVLGRSRRFPAPPSDVALLRIGPSDAQLDQRGGRHRAEQPPPLARRKLRGRLLGMARGQLRRAAQDHDRGRQLARAGAGAGGGGGHAQRRAGAGLQ
eukprot:552620-Prorocentrum_minimum.AAC.1